MEVIQAKETDLIEILYLLRVCILDMNQQGLKHWNSVYPGPHDIKADLAENKIFVAKEKGVCKGMITLDNEEPDEYKGVQWKQQTKKPLYIHRLAVHPRWQGHGIAQLLIDFAEDYAKKNGFDGLRIDIYSSSIHARHLCEKHMFVESGEFFSSFQKEPFICFEKAL